MNNRLLTLKKKLSGLAVVALLGMGLGLVLPSTLFSFDEYNRNWRNIAIDGYDTVAYFTKGKPTEGSSDYKYKWKDATWYFANQEHLDLFKKNPKKYAPQYGGYCAWAVGAKGKLYDIEPDVWKIVDGKLYLNYSEKIGERWEADIPGFISSGDKIWQKLLEKEGL